jgi:hypothetical protein
MVFCLSKAMGLLALLTLLLATASHAQAVTVGPNCTVVWTANVEPDLATYRVYGTLTSTAVPPVQIAKSIDVPKPTTSTTCAALGLTTGGNLSVQVDAVDALGNRSPKSIAVVAVQDVSPPAQPTGVTITPNP